MAEEGGKKPRHDGGSVGPPQLTRDMVLLVLSMVPWSLRLRCRRVCKLWQRWINASTTELPTAKLNDAAVLSLRHCPVQRVGEGLSCSVASMRFVRCWPLVALDLPSEVCREGNTGLDNLRFLTRLSCLTLRSAPVVALPCAARVTSLVELRLENPFAMEVVDKAQQTAIVLPPKLRALRVDARSAALSGCGMFLKLLLRLDVTRHLTVLDVRGDLANATVLNQIVKLKNLTELTLEAAKKVDWDKFKGFSTLVNLRALYLLSGFESADVTSWSKLPRLSRLIITHQLQRLEMLDPTAPVVCNSNALQQLCLHSLVSVKSSHIGSYCNLRELEIANASLMGVDEGMVPCIARLSQLEAMSMSGAMFPEGSLVNLARCLSRLSRLMLTDCAGVGLRELGYPWPSLRTLQLDALPGYDWQFSCLDNLSSLIVQRLHLTVVTLDEISNCPSLSYFSWRESKVLTSHLNTLLDSRSLKSLHLYSPYGFFERMSVADLRRSCSLSRMELRCHVDFLIMPFVTALRLLWPNVLIVATIDAAHMPSLLREWTEYK